MKAFVVCLFVALGCGVYWHAADAGPVKRSVPDVNSSTCSSSTPCGWEVYRQYVRTIDEFIPSPCTCPTGTRCVRSSDDISISAYVHRCKNLDEIGEGQEWSIEVQDEADS